MKEILLFWPLHFHLIIGLCIWVVHCVETFFRIKDFSFYFARYSWCSSRLIDDEFRLKASVELNDMIPMESNPTIPSLIIGHNVGFDRTYIKEQYQLEVNKKK